MGNTSVDQFIGRRIRERRQLLGLRSQELGPQSGCFPNRSAGTSGAHRVFRPALLFQLADALDASPASFFKGLEQKLAPVTTLHELMLNLEGLQSREYLMAVSRLVRALAAE
jgi:hypothetical protein